MENTNQNPLFNEFLTLFDLFAAAMQTSDDINDAKLVRLFLRLVEAREKLHRDFETR